jgi:hypothetical protein
MNLYVVWRNRSLESRPNARAYESLFTLTDPATRMAFSLDYIAATKYGSCEVYTTPGNLFQALDSSTAVKPILIEEELAREFLGWTEAPYYVVISGHEAVYPPHPDAIGSTTATTRTAVDALS